MAQSSQPDEQAALFGLPELDAPQGPPVLLSAEQLCSVEAL